VDVVRASKRLSYVLRHRPDSVGLSLDDAGWVEVDALLAALGLSRDELDRVVATNDKRRFAFDATGTRIRASQGHSVRVDLGYAARRPPDTLFHGTPERNVAAILAPRARRRPPGRCRPPGRRRSGRDPLGERRLAGRRRPADSCSPGRRRPDRLRAMWSSASGDGDPDLERRMSRPEGELPTALPMNRLLVRTPDVVVALLQLQVYTTGVAFELGARGGSPGFLCGVQAADGRRATNARFGVGDGDGDGDSVFRPGGGSGGSAFLSGQESIPARACRKLLRQG
jgi:hypothetical protein